MITGKNKTAKHSKHSNISFNFFICVMISSLYSVLSIYLIIIKVNTFLKTFLKNFFNYVMLTNYV